VPPGGPNAIGSIPLPVTLPPNPVITIQWLNNQWLPNDQSQVWDPNFEILSFNVSAPGSGGGPVTAPVCSNNNGGQSISTTCAAEVFVLSPELYLSEPHVQHVGGGSATFDSITSLPPVL